MMTATQIVDALGGTVEVAKALELTPSTVSSWKTSGSIPKWRMAGIREIARDKGVSLESPTTERAA
jgi:hypothetical protein